MEATNTKEGKRPIRVFLLDDHELVRRGLRDIIDLEDDMTVVSEAGTAEEALRRVPPTRPDVAVLDVRLPDGSGVEVCRELRSADPALRCLMLTSFDDDTAILGAVLAGASGYLLKQLRGRDIVNAIRHVAAGGSLLDPAVTGLVVSRVRDERTSSVGARLTGQEQKILGYLAEGMTNRQIAERMYLAEKTVKNYVSHLLAKLGMTSRTEAAVYAARLEERAHLGSTRLQGVGQ